MHINKIVLEGMLRAYQEELINELVYYKEDFIDNVDLVQDTEETIKSIDRVLDGKEKLIINKDIHF